MKAGNFYNIPAGRGTIHIVCVEDVSFSIIVLGRLCMRIRISTKAKESYDVRAFYKIANPTLHQFFY